jgi:hypothetical protein
MQNGALYFKQYSQLAKSKNEDRAFLDSGLGFSYLRANLKLAIRY